MIYSRIVLTSLVQSILQLSEGVGPKHYWCMSFQWLHSSHHSFCQHRQQSKWTSLMVRHLVRQLVISFKWVRFYKVVRPTLQLFKEKELQQSHCWFLGGMGRDTHTPTQTLSLISFTNAIWRQFPRTQLSCGGGRYAGLRPDPVFHEPWYILGLCWPALFNISFNSARVLVQTLLVHIFPMALQLSPQLLSAPPTIQVGFMDGKAVSDSFQNIKAEHKLPGWKRNLPDQGLVSERVSRPINARRRS